MSVKRIASLSSPVGALIGDRSTGIGQCEEDRGSVDAILCQIVHRAI